MARRFLPATPEKLTEAVEQLQDREHVVASSCITVLKYDFISENLIVTFTDGSSYEYSGIDIDVFRGLKAAYSKGQYFNEYIRDVFPYSKVG